MDKEKLSNFLYSHSLMVISTIGDEYPESAVVEYSSDGHVIIFDTDSASRKFSNILRNPNVSVVVGWDNNLEEETLQLEGKCTLLQGEELDRYKKVHFAKIPTAQKWEHEPGTSYFKIEPVWARHTDLKKFPWTLTEINF